VLTRRDRSNRSRKLIGELIANSLGRQASGPKHRVSETSAELDYGPLAEWVGFNLRMAQEASFLAFARQARSVAGTRPGRFAMLTLINENPGISQTALGRAAGRDKSTLTPVLNDLVRRGWIRRQRNRDDRRTYLLTLTPDGKKQLRLLNACARRHERNLDRIIGEQDRNRFLAVLRRIAAEISDQ
jgi:DNA-binding MarR family transcriptional regulator